MKINQRFRIRKDIEGFIAYFQTEGAFELSEMAAVITDLLKENITFEALAAAIALRFPEANAVEEVRSVVSTYQEIGLLS